MSKRKRVLTASQCSLRRETKWHKGARAQQSWRGCDLSVYINRSRASMKSGVRQVHFRQYEDQYDKKQQRHQNE